MKRTLSHYAESTPKDMYSVSNIQEAKTDDSGNARSDIV